MKTLIRELQAEYRRIFRDPGSLLVLVGALALYAAFYPIPYRSRVLKDVAIIVVDEDQSDLSRRLVRMLDAHDLVRVAGAAESPWRAEAMVREGTAGGVVVIPPDFERRIRRGEQATVAAYADASYFLIYRQFLTAVLEATGTMSGGIEVRRLMSEGLPADQAMKARDPLPLVMRPLFNAAEGYDTYVVPAVLVLILQQTLLAGLGMVRGTACERRVAGRGWGRSVGSPSRPSSLFTLLGKTAAYYSLYLLHSLFYFGIVYPLYGFPQRADALTIFRFTTPFLLSVIFLGLALRGLFRTREMSIQLLLFTSLPALFLAGFAWPVEALPRWLAAFAKALPSTSAIPGFVGITLMGAGLQDVRSEWLMLWSLCGAYFAAAWFAEWLEPENSNFSSTSAIAEAVTGLEM